MPLQSPHTCLIMWVLYMVLVVWHSTLVTHVLTLQYCVHIMIHILSHTAHTASSADSLGQAAGITVVMTVTVSVMPGVDVTETLDTNAETVKQQCQLLHPQPSVSGRSVMLKCVHMYSKSPIKTILVSTLSFPLQMVTYNMRQLCTDPHSVNPRFANETLTSPVVKCVLPNTRSTMNKVEHLHSLLLFQPTPYCGKH